MHCPAKMRLFFRVLAHCAQCVNTYLSGSMISAITNKGTCYTCSFNSSRQEDWKPNEDWTLLNLFKPETKVSKISSHKKYGLKCKFSPDSKFLVTTSADHTAKLWNTDDNTHIKVDLILSSLCTIFMILLTL